jgi:hypothetical protein
MCAWRHLPPADHFFAVVGQVFHEHGTGPACCRSKKFG